MNNEIIIQHTQRWIAEAVIGLNLCPFARRVFDAGLIRFAVTHATDTESLRDALCLELQLLNQTAATEIETSILILPNALAEFLDYNDFVNDANDLIRDLELEGVIQLASFHPRYQFAGTQPNDVENYTNRSPYPMLHLLREDSISAVNDDPAKLDEIPRRNIETLRRLGLSHMQALLARVTS